MCSRECSSTKLELSPNLRRECRNDIGDLSRRCSQGCLRRLAWPVRPHALTRTQSWWHSCVLPAFQMLRTCDYRSGQGKTPKNTCSAPWAHCMLLLAGVTRGSLARGCVGRARHSRQLSQRIHCFSCAVLQIALEARTSALAACSRFSSSWRSLR